MTQTSPLTSHALDALRQAGRVASDVREAGARLIVAGARVRDVCVAVEEEIARRGAGRRKSRTAARREISQADADRRMKELGVMVNAGGHVPIDESPACYKPSDEVIKAVTQAGLAEVEVRLLPIASIKGND